MSVPSAWIDRIFEKLTLVYGAEFLNRWKGVPLEEVKADWARELDGLENRPEAIKYALDHLPTDKAPTVLQFRELTRRAPEKQAIALPPPEVNPAAVARAIEMANKAFNTPVDRLARQREHMAMDLRGERISPAQRDFWRRALRTELVQRYGIDTAERGFHIDHLAEAVRRKGVYA